MSGRIITPVSEVLLLAKDFHSATAAAGTFTTVNEVQTYDTWDFDQASPESAAFSLIAPMAGRWGATVYWTAASGSGGVYWLLSPAQCSVGATLDAPAGRQTGAASTSEGAVKLSRTDIPIAIIESLGERGFLAGEISRQTGESADTLNADARLLALVVRFYS